MKATPTWMQDYGKVAVSFDQNWWREHDMSAVSIDQQGAVQTWWEACSGIDGDGSRPTLAGFVTVNGAKRLRSLVDQDREALHDHILDAIQRVYDIDAKAMGVKMGGEITASGTPDEDGLVVSRAGITVTYKSWKEDAYTNSQDKEESASYFPTDYGDRYLQQAVGPLFFAGTETAHGSGHMEGAIVAGQRASEEVSQHLSKNKVVQESK